MNETIPPPARIWRAAMAAAGWACGPSASPGYMTLATSSAAGEERARPRRRSPTCRSTRRWSVRSPRRTRKQSSGPGTPPIAFWRNRSRSATASSLVTATPTTVSEWPARYFVAEWNTMSAPSSSGSLEGRRGERVVDDDERTGPAGLGRALADDRDRRGDVDDLQVAGSSATRTRRGASARSAPPTGRPGPRRGRRSGRRRPIGRWTRSR